MKAEVLPGRLEAVVSLVPEHADCVADIGYDHGYALILLADRLPTARLCGVEKIPDAARRFYTAVPAETLERIELFTGDGFQPIQERDLDTAILAGMGEGTLLNIAARHPALQTRVRSVVVCTPQMPAVVRPAFAGLGYGIRDERIAFDGRRYYEVIAFDRDLRPAEGGLELLFGPRTLALPGARAYLEARREQWSELIRHHGATLLSPEHWPPATAENAGDFQR
ncbi:MAG: tRNA (adenine(22)-N(1))-methyltransferase TrmK, partial [Myxococcota bacterium]